MLNVSKYGDFEKSYTLNVINKAFKNHWIGTKIYDPNGIIFQSKFTWWTLWWNISSK